MRTLTMLLMFLFAGGWASSAGEPAKAERSSHGTFTGEVKLI
ncbi:MAG: hypothetical protein OEN01_06845 [Candidatus Krumholzibacteria bacterium]|nr:hypothetical protein [Candidatus Krumholzibacteria bacterium]